MITAETPGGDSTSSRAGTGAWGVTVYHGADCIFVCLVATGEGVQTQGVCTWGSGARPRGVEHQDGTGWNRLGKGTCFGKAPWPLHDA